MAVVKLLSALIDVDAGETTVGRSPALIASTNERSIGVGTCSVGVARIAVALVDISTLFSVTSVSNVATTFVGADIVRAVSIC